MKQIYIRTFDKGQEGGYWSEPVTPIDTFISHMADAFEELGFAKDRKEACKFSDWCYDVAIDDGQCGGNEDFDPRTWDRAKAYYMAKRYIEQKEWEDKYE